MPVPLSGLAKNFKAIDVTTNGNASTYLETSSSTTSISSPSNYMRPQGLNNSNTSTMSSRSKLVSNSSSSVNSSAGIKNFQHISSGSYSKLKSKFNKENTNSSPSSVTNHNNNSNMHTPESKSIIDSSSQSFSTIKESFKNLERSESQTLLNARNSNYKTVTSTVPCSKQTQYLTMPLKKSRNTNSNNNFRAMIDTMEPLTPTVAPIEQSKRHDSSEAESSSSLLLSLSSMSSYASLKENCKQTSSSSTSSCENEPSIASVSDKIKKLSNETSSSTLKYNQQEHTLKKRTSAYSSTSSLAVKSSKHLEETNGICSNHSMSSVSVFNSDTSSSPSSTSPNSNKAQVSRVYLKGKVLIQCAV
jgi:hypothetical protein